MEKKVEGFYSRDQLASRRSVRAKKTLRQFLESLFSAEG
jgi:hypothetical protein